MTSIKAHREKSLADAKEILESGLTTLDALSVTLSTLPYHTGGDSLSKAEAAFVAALSGNDGADVEKANDVVDAAYKAARDALCLGCEHVRIFERFIGLHCPKMEDGNNFGVTVQMTIGKHLKEQRESWEKSLTETSKYYSSRAEAIDKFSHIPKTSKSETKSTSKSSSTGGKDGDESKESSSVSTEEKTSNGGTLNIHRIKALAALDAQMYVDLVAALKGMMDGYVIVLDNMEKNLDKLENPRGRGYGGYGSGGSSMVY
mmetsp:Transcript_16799/g.35094  ORF Transcript_16799/g.35094 Transcript_16799/m.35094 type:complete len:260 (+) Transcript_16799:158-937(+)